MKRKAKVILSLILILSMLFAFGCSKRPAKEDTHLRIEREDWADDVKTALNDLLTLYGIDSKNYAGKAYAVFDFDNTSSIFDIEEQLSVYQLQVMAFAVEPEDMKGVLLTGLLEPDKDLTELGYGKGSLYDWIDDICAAYSKLWNAYGPFSAAGVAEDRAIEIQKDPQWLEFAAKMRALYSLVYDAQSASIAYPWVTYWFTGMTEEEIYDLTVSSIEKYKDVDTSLVKWTSPESIASKTGTVSCEWVSGIQVTENMKELWAALDDNGIDVWVCSASCTGAIRAAIDVFGLHGYCKGMLAMTNVIGEDGRYLAECDTENGCGFYALEDGSWTRMDRPTKAQTQGAGKVTAIVNAVAPEYEGMGPIAGFMDSTGDFNFCTEFSSLKLAVCFNRANRKVTDGGGLIAEVAVYERDTLGYDLAGANAAGDTLYVLQGRDENGKRALRNSNATLLYGSSEEKLFRGPENEEQLKYITENSMTVSDILDRFAIKEAAGENGFDFGTGFLSEYSGYHSRD